MGKAPSFQFYVKDWLSDPELQCVSASSRGIWIDALCYMWQAPERGKLVGTIEELSKLLRATNGDFTQFMEDLKRHQFADVTFCNNEVTIVNRRMIREEMYRKSTRLRVLRYRSNAKCNGDVTHASPSPSPIPSKKKGQVSITDFSLFWDIYPKRVKRKRALEVWTAITNRPDIGVILQCLKVQVAHKKNLQGRGQFTPDWPDPERWLKDRRWEDEIPDHPIGEKCEPVKVRMKDGTIYEVGKNF